MGVSTKTIQAILTINTITSRDLKSINKNNLMYRYG